MTAVTIKAVGLGLPPRNATLAVSLIGPTPEGIEEAYATWLPSETPQLHSGDKDDIDHRIWYVERQSELAGGWKKTQSNHDADNRVLKQVSLANRTLTGSFDWLAVGDADTCFDMPRLAALLGHINASRRIMFGVPFSPEKCNARATKMGGVSCCTGEGRDDSSMQKLLARKHRMKAHLPGNFSDFCCNEASARRGKECLMLKSRGLRKPPDDWAEMRQGIGTTEFAMALAWYHGGSGVLLSRGLINSIRPMEWLECIQRLKSEGGDVRLASCVYTFSGIGLTHLEGLATGVLSDHKKCLTARANASYVNQRLVSHMTAEEQETLLKPNPDAFTHNLLDSTLPCSIQPCRRDLNPAAFVKVLTASKWRTGSGTAEGVCISTRRDNNAESQQCSSDALGSDIDGGDCTLTPIRYRLGKPRWAPGLPRVEACFRCCLQKATARFQGRNMFWERVWTQEARDPHGADHFAKLPGALGKAIGYDPDTSVVIGLLSAARYATAGATYLNHTIVRPRKQALGDTQVAYGHIYGWGGASRKALEKLMKLQPSFARQRPHVIFTSGAQQLPEGPAKGRSLDQLELLDAPGLKQWWVTNPSIRHPRLSAFPRGVKSSARWSRAMFTMQQQERRESNGRELLFCSCMRVDSHAARADKLAALRLNGFDCNPECKASTPGDDGFSPYIKGLFGHRFVASPRGAGIQNHRDWEALYAGAIPLVDYDPKLLELWEGLPVVMVRDWTRITHELLNRIWRVMRKEAWKMEKLYWPYWLGQLGILPGNSSATVPKLTGVLPGKRRGKSSKDKAAKVKQIVRTKKDGAEAKPKAKANAAMVSSLTHSAKSHAKASLTKKDGTEAKLHYKAKATAATASSSTNDPTTPPVKAMGADRIAQLKELAALMKQDILTKAEFAQQKAALLRWW